LRLWLTSGSLKEERVQTIHCVDRGSWVELSFPDPAEDILPGSSWGKADELFTSAYWAAIGRSEAPSAIGAKRLGETLIEEVSACLLGGYGIPAEIGLAAFDRVLDSGLLAEESPAEEAILEVLSAPLTVGNRSARYRFARQKSHYLANAIRRIQSATPPLDQGVVLRDWLREIPGIGWKTASWVARNWLDADDVAILDIHVVRAGQLAGVFGTDARLPRDYRGLESLFVEWSFALGVRPSVLDTVIWREMRSSPHLVAKALEAMANFRQPKGEDDSHKSSPPPLVDK